MPFLIFNFCLRGLIKWGIPIGWNQAFQDSNPADDTQRAIFYPNYPPWNDHISQQGGKEIYLPNGLWMGYVSSQEGSAWVNDAICRTRSFFSGKTTLPVVKVADLSPIHFSEKIPPQMVPMDLNIGFQGLDLIQGQIYNPGSRWCSSSPPSVGLTFSA